MRAEPPTFVVFKRKVQRVGRGTLSVSLPKNWADKHGIVPGQTLFLSETLDGDLLVRRSAEEQDRPGPVVLVDEDFGRSLTTAYLRGHREIRVRPANPKEFLTASMRERVVAKAKDFMGLEVAEETRREMVLRVISAPEGDAGNVKELVVGTARLTYQQLRDLALVLRKGGKLGGSHEDLLANVVSRGDEVDRWYFRSVRQIRAALQATAGRERGGRGSVDPLHLLDYRLVAFNVEEVGDRCEDACKALLDAKLVPGEVDVLAEMVRDEYAATINALATSDPDAAFGVIRRKVDVTAEARKLDARLTSAPVGFHEVLLASKVFHALLQVHERVVDVCDLIT